MYIHSGREVEKSANKETGNDLETGDEGGVVLYFLEAESC